MPGMARLTHARRIVAIAAAYALALQGMFAPLAASAAVSPGLHLVICSGLGQPDEGGQPQNPAGADHDHCAKNCCGFAPLAAAPATGAAGTAGTVVSAILRGEPVRSLRPDNRRRTQFPRAPPRA
jgi:hypothetical protein